MEKMKRSDFLKKSIGLIGAATILPALSDANEKEETVGACSVTPTETAGPFSTKVPTSVAYSDIVLDRKGVAVTIKIIVQNVNNNCAVLANAVVDIWHCDAEGNYSEYKTKTTEHFLRGRQVTDNEGVVMFKSIFPGWYPGRAPHIHAQVLNSKGTNLLITQIAFPEDICTIIYKQGAYVSRGTAFKKNEKDSIFSDGFANELASVTGNVKSGFVITHTLKVKA
jgi:protocatechuate 3,4-dioxygenase beta subunit